MAQKLPCVGVMNEKELVRRVRELLEKIQTYGGNIVLSSQTPLHIQYQFLKEVLERLEDEIDHHFH